MKIDKKIIKELSDYLNEFNLTELEYTEKDKKLKSQKIMYLLTIKLHLSTSNLRQHN